MAILVMNYHYVCSRRSHCAYDVLVVLMCGCVCLSVWSAGGVRVHVREKSRRQAAQAEAARDRH